MKKSSPNKELLIDWLRSSLDFHSYPGLMEWSDKAEEIFYVKWLHKSSEQWTDDELVVFRAWAIHKGKLDGKNPKQLKATFRCALNSKKELMYLKTHKDRERRYWKFVDPNTVNKDKIPKKKRKNNKASNSESAIPLANTKSAKIAIGDGSFPPKRSISRNEDPIPRPTKLPAIDTFSNFQPLTPPDQANENSYTFPDIKFSEEQINELGKCGLNTSNVDHSPASIPSANVDNNFVEHFNKACTVLPPFEIFGSFRNITPPPQMNEVPFIATEYIPNYTPPPDQNRLTPPQIPYHTPQEPSSQSNAEVYQPNGWTSYNGGKESRNLGDYFSNEFIGLYKSSTQEPENNTMDFLTEMDQFVPVTNTSINLQFHTRFGQSNVVNRVSPNNLIQTDLERLDDYFLCDDVDSEACRRLLQEFNSSS